MICSRLPGSNQNSWVPAQGFLLRFLFSFAFVSPCLCFLFLGLEPGACTCHWLHEVACPWGCYLSTRSVGCLGLGPHDPLWGSIIFSPSSILIFHPSQESVGE